MEKKYPVNLSNTNSGATLRPDCIKCDVINFHFFEEQGCATWTVSCLNSCTNKGWYVRYSDCNSTNTPIKV